ATLAELAEAQRRTEETVAKLTERVDELAEAQRRTEETVAKLTERVDKLAEAQRRTEEEIRRLTEEMRDIRRQMGGIAMTVGYGLEDRAYPALPALLLRDYGIEVVERLKRQFVQDREGQYIEVNIFGEAKRNGEVLTIVGESKAQLSKNDVDNFVRRKLSRLKEVYPDLFPVLVTFMTTEWDVEEYARHQGIAVYYSYDF
ncbi:MAG: chordopoxvirus fusion protein, partial [Armatimonadota bacterium]